MPRGDAPGLTRTRLHRARRQHLLRVQDAIADGLDAAELAHGEQQHAAVIDRLLRQCADPRGRAPMLLRAEARHGR